MVTVPVGVDTGLNGSGMRQCDHESKWPVKGRESNPMADGDRNSGGDTGRRDKGSGSNSSGSSPSLHVHRDRTVRRVDCGSTPPCRTPARREAKCPFNTSW